MSLDLDNGGSISRDELKDAFIKMNEKDWSCECSHFAKNFKPLSDKSVDQILDKVDQDKNG